MAYLRSQIARLTNVNIETLRYYEKHGIISIPKRSEKGYRIYDEETVKKLNIIRHAKTCGLTLEETKEILCILNAENIDYNYVIDFINKRMELIDVKIEQLNRIKEIFKTVKSNILNNVECPIKKSFI